MKYTLLKNNAPAFFASIVVAVAILLLLDLQIKVIFAFIFGVITFLLYKYLISDDRASTKIPSQLRFLYLENSFQPIFIFIYAFSIALVILVPSIDNVLYVEWSKVSLLNLLRHMSSILLTTFFPGYILLRFIDYKKAVTGLAVVVFSYILSLFFTPLISYVLILSGGSILQHGKLALVSFNIILLIAWTILHRKEPYKQQNKQGERSDFGHLYSASIFICLLALLIIATYGIYGPNIIGDQWGHHGMALIFQKFGFPTDAGIVAPAYPWWFHVYLASLFTLSGLPSINAYSSLNFLNIMPIVAFYVMLSQYFKKYRKIPIVATVFAFFTSGYGWIYVQFLKAQSPTYHSALQEIIYSAWLKTTDILTPNSFIIAAHPDATTPCQLIGLVSFFMLIYIIKLETKFMRYSLLMTLVAVGYLGHTLDMILTIGILSLWILFSSSITENIKLGLSTITGLVAILIIDLLAPGKYYIIPSIRIFGYSIPILLICNLSILISLLFSFMAHTHSFAFIRKIIAKIEFSGGSSRSLQRNRTISMFKIAFVILICYMYALCFVIWNVINPGFSVWYTTGGGIRGFYQVPWYFYPMRLGIIGALAIASILYLFYQNKGNNMKYFHVFFMWLLTSLMLGSFFTEYRMNKYLNLALGVFAAYAIVLIFDNLKFSFIPGMRTHNLRKFVLTPSLLALIIVGAVTSPLIYVEWNILEMRNPRHSPIGMRVPLPEGKLEALNWLRLNLSPLCETVVSLPGKERGARNAQSELFLSNVWKTRANLYVPIFEVTLPENFFDIARKAQLKYVYLDRHDLMRLDSDSYRNSFLAHLYEYLPIVFNNTEVTIYQVPEVSSPSLVSNLAIVTSNILDPHFSPYSKLVGWSDDSFTDGWRFGGAESGVTNYSMETDGEVATVKSAVNSTGPRWARYRKDVHINTTNYPYLIVRAKGKPYRVEAHTTDGKYYGIVGEATDFTIEMLKLPENKIVDFIIIQAGYQAGANVVYYDYLLFAGNFEPFYFYPIEMASLSKLNYSTVSEVDNNRFNYATMILPYDPDDSKSTQYLEWVKKGGHLIVLGTLGTFVRTYEDHFDQENNLTSTWEVISGNWLIDKGEYRQNVNKGGGMAVTGDTTWSHYIVEAKVKVVNASDPDNHIGLVFYYQDSKNFYYLNLKNSTLVLHRRIDGIGKAVWITKADRLDNLFYTLKVEINGSTFKFYLNGVFKGEYVEEGLLTHGKIGLMTHNLDGRFDDVLVWSKGYAFDGAFARFLSLPSSNKTITVDGIKGAGGSFSLPKITVPVFDQTAFYDNEIIAYYTRYDEEASPLAFLRKVGKGEIIYMATSPYFSALRHASKDLKRSLFVNLGSLIKVLHLPYLEYAYYQQSDEIRPFNYAIGEIEFAGRVKFKSSFFAIPYLSSMRVDLNFTQAKMKINGRNSDQATFSDALISNLQAHGRTESTIVTSRARILPYGWGIYPVVEFDSNFNWILELSNNARVTMELLKDKNIFDIEVESGLIELTIHDVHLVQDRYIPGHPLDSIVAIAKNPAFYSNGQTYFEVAYLTWIWGQTIFGESYAPGRPLTVRGNCSFIVNYVDDRIIRISNVTLDGALSSDIRLWDEWNIPWLKVFGTEYHTLSILMLFCIFAIWCMFKRKSKSKQTFEMQ